METLRVLNTKRAALPSAAMHQICRIALQNAALDDGVTVKQIRENARDMPYMQEIVMIAATHAEIVFHKASQRIPHEVQQQIWQYKHEGDIEQGQKIALRQLDLQFFDVFDHRRFHQWWTDNAPQGNTPDQAYDTIPRGDPTHHIKALGTATIKTLGQSSI